MSEGEGVEIVGNWQKINLPVGNPQVVSIANTRGLSDVSCSHTKEIAPLSFTKCLTADLTVSDCSSQSFPYDVHHRPLSVVCGINRDKEEE